MATAPAPASTTLRVAPIRVEPLQQFVIHHVPWSEYEALCRLWDGRGFRMTYDGSTLELMTTSDEHEAVKCLWCRLVETLSLELDVEIRSRGSMTFKRHLKERGLEPDGCLWIENEPILRGRKGFDIERDPMPDLALEVEFSNSALDKMDIYARLGFPEIWRLDGEKVRVHLLRDGAYAEAAASRCFPDLPMDELSVWLLRPIDEGENARIRAFAAWVRAGMPRGGAEAGV